MQDLRKKLPYLLIFILSLSLLTVPANLHAKSLSSSSGQGNWWDVEPESENPSPYYDSILYSEIAPKIA